MMGADASDGGNPDFVIYADVLGAFGVPSEHVRRRADLENAAVESAISSVLESAPDPTECLRRTISTSDQGVDMPARYRQDRFWDAVADVLDSLELALSVDARAATLPT